MKKTKNTATFLVSAVVTAALAFAIVSDEKATPIAEVIRNVYLPLLAAYFSLSLLGVVFRALRYQLLVSALVGANDSPSFSRFFVVTLIRNALVDFFPARLGEASYFYVLNRLGVPLAHITSSFGLCLVLDLLALFVLLSLFFLVLPLIGGSSWGASLPFFELLREDALLKYALLIGTALGIVIVMMYGLRLLPRLVDILAVGVVRVSPRSGNRLPSFVAGAESALRIIADDIRRVQSRVLFLKLLLLTLALRFCKYASLYALLLAVVRQWDIFPEQISPVVALVAFIFAEASASLPIAGVMGFGAYEATWSAVFLWSDIALPSPTRVAFVVHLITQIKGYSLGILGVFGFLAFIKRGERQTSVAR